MKKLTLIIVLFLIILLPFVTAGTGGKKAKEVVIKVGTNAEYPPFEFKENGEFKGIDMELVSLIAEKLGVKYEIIDMEFDSLIPSLQAKKIDMAIAAITITNERKQKVDFSIPYYTANQALIAKKDSDIKIATIEDLTKYVIGTQNGTTGQIWVEDNLIKTGKMPKENLKKYPTNIEAITDLLNGNVDLVIIDDSAAKGYEKLKPIKIVYVIDTGENYGIAFPKGSPWVEKVNKVLRDILSSEDWIKILQKYM